MDRVTWMLIVIVEVMLVLEAECEDVPGSFCGVAPSSSESMGLRIFAFCKSRGIFNSAVFLFPFSPWTFFSLWRP